MKNVGNNKKGFTIIEVVLVLAIAGLIFLIVFLAVPALQSNRRDTQRRSDLGRFTAQLENFAANRNGNYPANQADLDNFVDDYMDDFRDPSTGNDYDATVTTGMPGDEGEISYARSRRCNANNDGFDTAAGNRNVAVATFLENGGVYCQDNSQ